MTTLSSHPIFKTIIENDKFFGASSDIDMDRINAILSQEEVPGQGRITYPKSHVTGTITSRIRSLLSECVVGMSKVEFQSAAETHPAFDKIVAEFLAVSGNKSALNELFDEVEAIGVMVFFDSVTKRVSLGLDPVAMGSGIKEYTLMKDIKNKKVLDRINGKSFHYGYVEEEEEDHEIDVLNRTFYVSFNI